MAGGIAASSKGPPFHLIPTVALERIAERFELGIERKGARAWNAVSNNQSCLLDREFLIERLSHVIHHSLKLRDKLASGSSIGGLEDDDDAGAIAWGGVFILCAIEKQFPRQIPEPVPLEAPARPAAETPAFHISPPLPAPCPAPGPREVHLDDF